MAYDSGLGMEELGLKGRKNVAGGVSPRTALKMNRAPKGRKKYLSSILLPPLRGFGGGDALPGAYALGYDLSRLWRLHKHNDNNKQGRSKQRPYETEHRKKCRQDACTTIQKIGNCPYFFHTETTCLRTTNWR